MSRGRSVCPSCHAGVSDDAAFCPTCGTALGPLLVTDADGPAPTEPEVVFGRSSTRRQWWPWAALVAVVLLTRAITADEGGDAPTIGDAAAASTSTTAPSTTIFSDPTTTTSLPERLTAGNGALLGERTGLELWINAFFQGTRPVADRHLPDRPRYRLHRPRRAGPHLRRWTRPFRHRHGGRPSDRYERERHTGATKRHRDPGAIPVGRMGRCGGRGRDLGGPLL